MVLGRRVSSPRLIRVKPVLLSEYDISKAGATGQAERSRYREANIVDVAILYHRHNPQIRAVATSRVSCSGRLGSWPQRPPLFGGRTNQILT